MRAAQRIQQVKDANLPLKTALDQLDLFGGDADAAERAFLELLLRHPVRQELGGVGRETIASRLDAYARHAREAPSAPDMFNTPPPGLGDVLAAAYREAGLEPPASLRALRTDPYSPPAAEAPEPPPALPKAAGADPVARTAEAAGLDVEAAQALAEVRQMIEAGKLPPELADLADELRLADDLVAKTERAAESWQAAVTCAVGR